MTDREQTFDEPLVARIRQGIGSIGTYVTATGEPVTREGKQRKAALEALDTLLRLVAEADGYLSFFYYQGEMPNDREQLNDLISRLRSVNRV